MNFWTGIFTPQSSMENWQWRGRMPRARTMFMAYSHMALAEVLFELNQFDSAQATLDTALRMAAGGHKYAYHWARLIDAFYAFRTVGETFALEKLNDAFAFGREQGYEEYYYWRAEALADLCVKAMENRIEVDYTCRLIQAQNLVPEITPQHLQDWPWNVRIYTLGDFRLVIKNQPVCLGRKIPKKPLNLLKAIVSLGNGNVHESRTD